MKVMKYIVVVLFLGLGFLSNAQVIERDGKKYVVKKDKILLDGNDVTSTFSIEEQAQLKAEFSKLSEEIKLKKKEEERIKKAEKEQKKAEKDKKRAESKQKKAEKALRQKEKIQSNYEKAAKNYEQAQSKYERLKKRGKLAPEDEAKWLEKIKKLNERVEKAEKKLKHS
jgi:chromosome segregation ATPase